MLCNINIFEIACKYMFCNIILQCQKQKTTIMILLNLLATMIWKKVIRRYIPMFNR